MDITITKNMADPKPHAVISLRGRIAAFHTSALREQFDALLSDGTKYYVLDLTHVEFLDSAGLAVLVNLLKRAQQEGGDVQMILPKSEGARRILRLTRFDKVFTIVETSEAAFQHS
jgi:anti-sigma B factor antagonist